MLLSLVLIAQAATDSIAAENDKETKEDIAKHRAMAAGTQFAVNGYYFYTFHICKVIIFALLEKFIIVTIKRTNKN